MSTHPSRRLYVRFLRLARTLTLTLPLSAGCKGDRAGKPTGSQESAVQAGSSDAPSNAPPKSKAPPAPQLVAPSGLGKEGKQLTGKLVQSHMRFALCSSWDASQRHGAEGSRGLVFAAGARRRPTGLV